MGITLNPGTLLNGNGIDVNSLVTASLAPRNAQVTALQQQQSDLQTQSSLLTSMNNDLSALASAANALGDVLGPLSAMSAQSSQTNILTASAQAGAAAGTHTVVVSTLATQGTIYTNAIKDANTPILPSGAPSAALSFQVGGSGGVTHDISISAGTNDTLNSLVSYINKQNWGVTASVLTDATGSRLAIYSNTTGSAGAVAITNNTSALVFNTPVGGTNASFTVDGIPFSSSSNTATGAIPNVTLNLIGAYSGVQVQVAVAPDVNQAEQAISNFVGAYNTIAADLNTQFTFNPTTNSEGPLAGDNALRSLQSSLLADVTYSPAAATLYTNALKDANTSLLPSGAQSADFQFQVGGSGGVTHDIAISPGTNDTLTSLVSYINQQNWGVNASVFTDSAGARLDLASNQRDGTGALAVIQNTTNLTFSSAAGSTFANLHSLGIAMNDDGTLSINSSQLNSALTSDPASVLNFFQNTAQTGFANNFAKDLQNLTNPSRGILNVDLKQNQTEQQNLSTSMLDLQDQISAMQLQLQTEYSRVNALLESFPYQMQAIQMELGITPTTSNRSPTAAG
jgi:flagellar hook-associated protein 2